MVFFVLVSAEEVRKTGNSHHTHKFAHETKQSGCSRAGTVFTLCPVHAGPRPLSENRALAATCLAHVQHRPRPRCVPRCHRQEVGHLLRAQPPERLHDHWERFALVTCQLNLFSHRNTSCHLSHTGSVSATCARTLTSTQCVQI